MWGIFNIGSSHLEIDRYELVSIYTILGLASVLSIACSMRASQSSKYEDLALCVDAKLSLWIDRERSHFKKNQ